jgi:hypothetical protein
LRRPLVTSFAVHLHARPPAVDQKTGGDRTEGKGRRTQATFPGPGDHGGFRARSNVDGVDDHAVGVVHDEVDRPGLAGTDQARGFAVAKGEADAAGEVI